MSEPSVRRVCENCNEPFTVYPHRVTDGEALFCSRRCTDEGKTKRAQSPAAIAQRFWAKVERGPDSACWPWRGARDRKGYGRFSWGGRKHKRSASAHRLALALTTGRLGADGRIAATEHGLHSCDNPACCNPAHLRWGTNTENIADCVARGRKPKGDTHHSCLRPETVPRGEERSQARVTAEQVFAIRLRYARGTISQFALAREFGISRTTIEDIVHRRTWKHVV
jgi:predicted DNA-binding protein (UPF0251 family)